MSYMSNEQAIKILHELKIGAGKTGDDSIISAIETAERAMFGGCATCKYEDVEPWDYPCRICSRGHVDRYTSR